jgi:hypothetical protein
MKTRTIKILKTMLDIFTRETTNENEADNARLKIIEIASKNTKCTTFGKCNMELSKCKGCKSRGTIIYDCCSTLTPEPEKTEKKKSNRKPRDQWDFIIGSKRNKVFEWLKENPYQTMADIKKFAGDSYYNLYKARPEIFVVVEKKKTETAKRMTKYFSVNNDYVHGK